MTPRQALSIVLRSFLRALGWFAGRRVMGR